MTISAELIAMGILGVSLVSLGWKVTGDLRKEIHLVSNKVTGELRQEIHLLGDRVGTLEHRMGNLEQHMGNLEQRMGNLEQRMARWEGWIEGRFIRQPELKAKPATSR